MSEAFFSRLTLRRDADAIAPLVNVFTPADAGEAMNVAHRLLWTTIAPDMRRAHQAEPNRAAFLWRAAEGRGVYYMLGPRPVVEQPYFRVETKPYAPDFSPGDRLLFDLRANATISRKALSGDRARGKPVDVAMDRMQQEERGGADRARRAERRMPAAEAAAKDWLQEQGERSGFRLVTTRLDAYDIARPPRRTEKDARIGVYDLRGVIEIVDPAPFVARVLAGFGRAKAFGCGLMLLRRAP